jgi:hypothetical protein
MQEIAAVRTEDADSNIPASTPQPKTSEKAKMDLKTAANEVGSTTLERTGSLSPSNLQITTTMGEAPSMMKTTTPKIRKAARRKVPSNLERHKYHDKVIIITVGEQVMRWPPHTYPLVLAAAKDAGKQMGSGGR